MKMVILAGGKGTRLWPVSTKAYPKQFLSFEGEASLLQKTIERLLCICAPSDIVIVTSEMHFFLVQALVGALGLQRDLSILVEPKSAGTAPAFALALVFLQEEKGLKPDEVVALIPADGFIAPIDRFVEAFLQGEKKAKEGFLVLLGVPPTREEVGYGYIELGEETPPFFSAYRFIEKPKKEVVETLFLDRRVLWNTGHVLVRADVFWQEMQEHEPVIGSLSFVNLTRGKSLFPSLPEISLDHALLEKSRRVMVYPMDVIWSDVGSWDSIYDLAAKDQEGNVKMGDVMTLGVKGSFFFGKERLLSAVGVEDLIVVDTKEALFLGKRGSSQQVKELVSLLKERAEPCKTVQRPWGSYTVIDEGEGYKVKKITVLPGHRLSLQMHHHRSEHWTVVRGKAFVEVGEKTQALQEQETTFIPVLAKHRLSNQTKELLQIIEIQSGTLLTEEDIVRFEDDYAREFCSTT